MTVSLVVFGVGVALMAAGGVLFRVRAISNRPAWGGRVVPLFLVGLVIAIPGLVLVILNR